MTKPPIKLGLSMRYLGYHDAAWRHPEVPSGGASDYGHFLRCAQAAERGLFDMVFFADGIGVRANDDPPGFAQPFQPQRGTGTADAAGGAGPDDDGISAWFAPPPPPTTSRITSPASSRRWTISAAGGPGWNVVTSWSEQEAWNFSREAHLDYDTRYERAREFVDVVTGLWDSWEPDAFVHEQGGRAILRPGEAACAASPGQAISRCAAR